MKIKHINIVIVIISILTLFIMSIFSYIILDLIGWSIDSSIQHQLIKHIISSLWILSLFGLVFGLVAVFINSWILKIIYKKNMTKIAFKISIAALIISLVLPISIYALKWNENKRNITYFIQEHGDLSCLPPKAQNIEFGMVESLFYTKRIMKFKATKEDIFVYEKESLALNRTDIQQNDLNIYNNPLYMENKENNRNNNLFSWFVPRLIKSGKMYTYTIKGYYYEVFFDDINNTVFIYCMKE